ncbi:hypothetical protein BBJ28_00021345 [Nothophytophthora sp. Chile5]|nr:hypothetical protein BBJ28_00021345 [Nothophytophthora sp. Chile5]
MRYQFLACASKLCERVTPGLKCSWRGQVVECSKTDETTVLECLSHASRYPDPKRDRLTTAQKVYIQEMTALRVKPSRIRNAMVQKLGIDPDDLPPLKKVQSYANYYRKTKLLNHDWYDEIVDYINAQAFSGGENDTKPFTFTVDQDSRGLPVVGIGSDADPFVVGITTKRLLSRLARPPESFVFHLDATYKLNQVGYPVLVCGISDRCRTFHLVALFVMSQQQEANTVRHSPLFGACTLA